MKKILSGMLFLLVLTGANCADGAGSLEADCAEEAVAKEPPPPDFPISANASNAIAPPQTQQLQQDDSEAETPEATATPHKIKLLMSGDFHGEDVEFKNGASKNWLGLFRKKNKYFLLPTSVKIKAVRDYMAYENSGDRSGKKVCSDYKLPDVFLLKNAGMLRASEVKTLFDGKETDSDSINRKYRQQFELNGKKYTLYVEDASKDGEEYLTEKSKMVISSGNLKQTIYEHSGCDDCGWDLCWVGDLDRDGKPDFFINLTNHYNSTVHRLFLSSQAGTGEIVREVAAFGTVGC
jgi:hypothetical protein